MHETIPFLSQIVILFGMALVVAWTFRMLRAPSILGYLLTGLVIGPSALHLIEAEQVEQFAEFGIVLLLFNIGLELSPKPLLEMGARLLGATVVQVFGTMAVAGATVLILGPTPLGGAVILGIGVALSSTAIVLKILTDRGEIRSAAGNLCTGILLLQDVFVLLVMMLLPLFAAGGEEGHSSGGALPRAAIGFVALIVITVTARKILPKLLNKIIQHGGKELTVLFAVLMACGGAWAASLFGWPLALGACVAGLLLSESDMRHQLVAEITPFRDVFNALFFISLGMSVSLASAAESWHLLLIAILATLSLKAVIMASAILIAGWPLRLAFHVGFAMSTVSEFSYVLGREAYRFELLPAASLDQLISYAVGTMMIGSVLVPVAGPLSQKLAGLLRPEMDHGEPEIHGDHGSLSSHVIIIGYGLNGENLARVLTSTQVPFCVVEMNPALIAKARLVGAAVVVGDATRLSILDHAGLATARALVVAMNDPQATRRIVSQVRAVRSDLYIVARTYFVGELDALYKFGANVVISADFEASVEIFSHVLKEFGVPDNILEAQVTSVRAGGYGVLRGLPAGRAEHIREVLRLLQTTATQTFYLSDTSPACNKTIAELNVRAESGVTIIAVVRDGKPRTNPPADQELKVGDVLVLVGSHAQLDAARRLLDPPG
jgi:CPA2 family monovalent cation:H+ antiporter-2